MKEIKFKSAIEMVTWLMENENTQLADIYGRRWRYFNFKFYFKDIGGKGIESEGLECLHLYSTKIGIVK